MGNAVGVLHHELSQHERHDQNMERCRRRLAKRMQRTRRAVVQRARFAIEAGDKASIVRSSLHMMIGDHDWAVPAEELPNLCADAARHDAWQCLEVLIEHIQQRGLSLNLLQAADALSYGRCAFLLKEALRPLSGAARAETAMRARLQEHNDRLVQEQVDAARRDLLEWVLNKLHRGGGLEDEEETCEATTAEQQQQQQRATERTADLSVLVVE